VSNFFFQTFAANWHWAQFSTCLHPAGQSSLFALPSTGQGSNIFTVVVVNSQPPQHCPGLGGVGLPPMQGAQPTNAVIHCFPSPEQVLMAQGSDLS